MNDAFSPDQQNVVGINATLFFTWLVMGLLFVAAWFATRCLRSAREMSRWQNLLEALVAGIRNQIGAVQPRHPEAFLPFIGTLFLFIAVSNILSVVPGFAAPTGSLSTTTALAICVFFAVPFYGIRNKGLWAYLKNYCQPTPFMLPFNVIGEFSRTLALAVRLFGNMMSGSMIAAILLAIVPFFAPIPILALSLLTGLIQAYIFAVLAMVYIASAAQTQDRTSTPTDT